MRLYEIDQPNKKVVFTFGRLNPPHYGHGGLIKTLQLVAKQKAAHWYLFVSSKNEPEKNPLTYEQKCHWIRILFPEVEGHLVIDPSIKTPLIAATWLYKQGFRSATFVAGEDDMESYSQMIKSGNEHGRKNPDALRMGKGFYFEPLEFDISARLASATNSRNAVTNNDPEAFARSILGPKITNPQLLKAVAKDMFPMVRKGMQLESINEDADEDERRAFMMRPENQKDTPISNALKNYTPLGDMGKIGSAVNKGEYGKALLPAAQLATNLIPGKAVASAASTAIGAARGIADESEELNKRTPSVRELAKKYTTTPDVIHRQINRGVKVEFEHTNDIEVATEIAMDHLGEKLDYYTRLAKVEEDDEPRTLTIRRSNPISSSGAGGGNPSWVDNAAQGLQQTIANKTAGIVPGTTYPTRAPVGTMYGSYTDDSGRKINKYVDHELTTRFKPDDEGPWVAPKYTATNTPVGTYLGSHVDDTGNRINKYSAADLTTNYVPADKDTSGYEKIIKNSPISPLNDKVSENGTFAFAGNNGGGITPIDRKVGINPWDVETPKEEVEENFADGKGPGRPGDSQRHGIPKKATMAELEKASHAEGRKGQLARWQMNMRRGKKRANEEINKSPKMRPFEIVSGYDFQTQLHKFEAPSYADAERYAEKWAAQNIDLIPGKAKRYFVKAVTKFVHQPSYWTTLGDSIEEEKKPKKPKTIIDGALKTLIAKGRSEDEAIADLKKEIDSKFYDLTETREGALNWLKSYLPTWPEYVLRDWLYRGLTAKEHNPPEHPKEVVDRSLAGEGMSAQTQWKLIPNFEFKIEKLHPDTQRRINIRAGGSANPMNVPKDAERHATQAALAQQQGGVRKEPVIGKMTPQGFELIEGWHRTIQHFKQFPNGYTGPAWVAMNAVSESLSEKTDYSRGEELEGIDIMGAPVFISHHAIERLDRKGERSVDVEEIYEIIEKAVRQHGKDINNLHNTDFVLKGENGPPREPKNGFGIALAKNEDSAGNTIYMIKTVHPRLLIGRMAGFKVQGLKRRYSMYEDEQDDITAAASAAGQKMAGGASRPVNTDTNTPAPNFGDAVDKWDKWGKDNPEAKLALGMHPVTGFASAAADTAHDLYHGKYGDAAGSALGMVPGVKQVKSLNAVRPFLSGLSKTARVGDKANNLAQYGQARLGEAEEDSVKPSVYLDMDGVLADFFGEWAKLSGVDHYKDINNVEAQLQMVREHPTFWIDLPMLPHAKALIQTVVKNYGEYRICSKPLEGDTRSEPGKLQWIKKHLSGMPPVEVILTADKAKFAKNDGYPNILVDDYGVNINSWRAAGGIGIKYDDQLFEHAAKVLQSLARSGVSK